MGSLPRGSYPPDNQGPMAGGQTKPNQQGDCREHREGDGVAAGSRSPSEGPGEGGRVVAAWCWVGVPDSSLFVSLSSPLRFYSHRPEFASLGHVFFLKLLSSPRCAESRSGQVEGCHYHRHHCSELLPGLAGRPRAPWTHCLPRAPCRGAGDDLPSPSQTPISQRRTPGPGGSDGDSNPGGFSRMGVLDWKERGRGRARPGST